MKFVVLSEREIEKYIVTEKHAVISITGPKWEHPKLPKLDSRVGLLRLKFHDVDREAKKCTLFSQEQAKTIWNFFQRYQSQIEVVVCQCEAGISRSSAVAAALARAIGQNDSEFFKYYIPNRLVYRVLLEAINEQRRRYEI